MQRAMGMVACYNSRMSDVTKILSRLQRGEAEAVDELLPQVYDELRKLAAAKLAREKPGQTLQATALVHDAYLRLVGAGQADFDGRGHFFAAAAEAMRRLLVERARQRKSLKHGGDWQRVELQESDLLSFSSPDQLLQVNSALDRLESEDKSAGELVKLCLFSGFSVDKAGELLEMSRATAYRHWAYARAWLKTELSDN